MEFTTACRLVYTTFLVSRMRCMARRHLWRTSKSISKARQTTHHTRLQFPMSTTSSLTRLPRKGGELTLLLSSLVRLYPYSRSPTAAYVSLTNNCCDGDQSTLARNSDANGVASSIKQMEDRFNRKFGYDYVLLNDQPFEEGFKKCVLFDYPDNARSFVSSWRGSC